MSFVEMKSLKCDVHDSEDPECLVCAMASIITRSYLRGWKRGRRNETPNPKEHCKDLLEGK